MIIVIIIIMVIASLLQGGANAGRAPLNNLCEIIQLVKAKARIQTQPLTQQSLLSQMIQSSFPGPMTLEIFPNVVVIIYDHPPLDTCSAEGHCNATGRKESSSI